MKKGNVEVSRRYSARRTSQAADLIIALLAALSYDRMSARRRQLTDQSSAYLEWIWRKDSEGGSGLTEWLRQDSSTFWITGNPGSGKSTHMKYLAEHESTPRILRRPRLGHVDWSPATDDFAPTDVEPRFRDHPTRTLHGSLSSPMQNLTDDDAHNAGFEVSHNSPRPLFLHFDNTAYASINQNSQTSRDGCLAGDHTKLLQIASHPRSGAEILYSLLTACAKLNLQSHADQQPPWTVITTNLPDVTVAQTLMERMQSQGSLTSPRFVLLVGWAEPIKMDLRSPEMLHVLDALEAVSRDNSESKAELRHEHFLLSQWLQDIQEIAAPTKGYADVQHRDALFKLLRYILKAAQQSPAIGSVAKS